jgi:hypothetical protein
MIVFEYVKLLYFLSVTNVLMIILIIVCLIYEQRITKINQKAVCEFNKEFFFFIFQFEQRKVLKPTNSFLNNVSNQ